MTQEAEDFPIQPGDRLGPYVVEEFLARGGMGVLLRGVDAHLDRPVAIKIVDPRFLQDRGFRQRFVRECKVLAKLRHPNIVSIYYFDEWEGTPFYAMELVEGTDLDRLAQGRERVAWKQASAWMAQCCRALEAARAAGVIHRDLKPANILLDAHGAIRIVDFGLAKSLEASKQLTAAAMVVGTPHYMSPEQAKGQDLDWRSDLYSLGATFFHVLAGRTPFDAPSAMEVVAAHISLPAPSLGGERRDLPAELVALIDGLLAKFPDQRGFDSYPEVASAIEAILEADPPTSPPGDEQTARIPGVEVTPDPYPVYASNTAQEPRATVVSGPVPAASRETVVSDPALEAAASSETVAVVSDPALEAAATGETVAMVSDPRLEAAATGETVAMASDPALVGAQDETVAVAPESPVPMAFDPARPGTACAWLEGAAPGPDGTRLDVALVRAPEVTFGTSDRNGIYLPWSRASDQPKRVSRQGHGAFVWAVDGYRLETRRHPSGAVNACRLGQGEPLGEGTHAVVPGDRLDLAGQYRLRLGGSREGGLRVELEVLDDATRSEGGARWYLVLFGAGVTLGAAPEAGLVLEAGGPGRAARLEADAEGFYFVPEVEGFTVGGRPVQGRRLLRAGDLVVGPGVRFRFHPVESPEDLWS